MVISGALSATVGGPVLVQYAGAGDLRVSPPGYSYRYGILAVGPDANGGLRAVIGGLGMQQYLYGLGEMPSSWPTEALKAQATASRTFAQKRRNGRAVGGLRPVRVGVAPGLHGHQVPGPGVDGRGRRHRRHAS